MSKARTPPKTPLQQRLALPFPTLAELTPLRRVELIDLIAELLLAAALPAKEVRDEAR
jgi:hypothetical protein